MCIRDSNTTSEAKENKSSEPKSPITSTSKNNINNNGAVTRKTQASPVPLPGKINNTISPSKIKGGNRYEQCEVRKVEFVYFPKKMKARVWWVMYGGYYDDDDDYDDEDDED